MSDTMLHGVLCMPPELWQDTELDKRQRYSRYLAASRRIEDDEREIERLRAIVDAKPMAWYIDFGKYGQITMRRDEMERAAESGAKVTAMILRSNDKV